MCACSDGSDYYGAAHAFTACTHNHTQLQPCKKEEDARAPGPAHLRPVHARAHAMITHKHTQHTITHNNTQPYKKEEDAKGTGGIIVSVWVWR